MAKQELEKPKEEKKPYKEEEHEVLVRILGYDIPGSRNIYAGLTRIKGVSWVLSNATCHTLNLEKTQRVSELKKEDIKKIEDYLKSLENLPAHLKNRPSDPETGETTHLFGHDLELKKEFDIKRLKKIKSYKGVRHANKLPVRGQRTRANFRAKGTNKAVGVRKKSA
ncbi:30S ribosomal protein S13 [Candidatus Pacearchaeota archaeon]|nr:30S ribosomal protein S13 [Candidatus Pacearchaeota archaeon]|tara:strand:+ start:460 stop:960 length:501 start_codon:yes stop_codon:yes gene_type:complete